MASDRFGDNLWAYETKPRVLESRRTGNMASYIGISNVNPGESVSFCFHFVLSASVEVHLYVVPRSFCRTFRNYHRNVVRQNCLEKRALRAQRHKFPEIHVLPARTYFSCLN